MDAAAQMPRPERRAQVARAMTMPLAWESRRMWTTGLAGSESLAMTAMPRGIARQTIAARRACSSAHLSE
jgi:hypothetical protein